MILEADRYDPVYNQTYREMASHYGIAIVPARPRKPKDKGADEGMVKIVSQRILAVLRNRQFFSLADVNTAISEELEKLIKRPFQKIKNLIITGMTGSGKTYLAYAFGNAACRKNYTVNTCEYRNFYLNCKRLK